MTIREFIAILVFSAVILGSWYDLKAGQDAIVIRLNALEVAYSDQLVLTERIRSEREDNKYTKKELDILADDMYTEYIDGFTVD